MRGFKAGSFERAQMPKSLQRLSPSEALESLESVDTAALWQEGKRLILLDVDNTLLPWRSHDIPHSTLEWLANAKSQGFDMCILSNTRNPERLERLAREMGLEFVRAKFKPSREMYLMALEKFRRRREETVMIGDQLLTDILGANRSGIDALWIRPIGKREFIGTRLLSRNLERLIGRFLYRYFQAADDATPVEPGRTGLFGHNVVREFAKFVIVGGSSTVIDLGLHFWLMHTATWQGQRLSESVGTWFLDLRGVAAPYTSEALSAAAFGPLKVFPVMLAILNSYFWNSRWTFRVAASGQQAKLITKFYVVALIGLVLNVLIGSAVVHVAPGGERTKWAIASGVAMVLVVFWNFVGQKFWTFRKDKKK